MLQLRGRTHVVLFALAVLALRSSSSNRLWAADGDSPTSVLAPPANSPSATTSKDSAIPPPTADSLEPSTNNIVRLDEPPTTEPLLDVDADGWAWQWVPAGIIYHSYMAGPQEPAAGCCSSLTRAKARLPMRRWAAAWAS